MLGTDRVPVTDAEAARGLDRPLRVFPMFENALRFGAGESIEEHQRRISDLWARFSSVATTNPYAWSRQARSAQDVRSMGPSNRMVSFPYPKLMNANDRVDQAAALIVCSAEAAKAAGVPRDRFVFPISGADANDHWFLTHRADFTSSPAIRLAGRCALARAGVGIDDVAYLDLYSCFPSAVEIGATELGLDPHDPGRQLTLTGGLGFAGGPGNNYVTHSIATLAARLRSDPGALGMVTGLGWYMTKHAMGLYSTEPPAGGFRYDSPQDDVDALPQCSPAGDYEGDATVETYTVVHTRDGYRMGIVIGRDAAGARFVANTPNDEATLKDLERVEGVGRRGHVRRADDGVHNLFLPD